MKTVKQKPSLRPVVSVTPASPSTSAWWLWLLLAFAAFLVALEVYWPAVKGPFLFDDVYLPFQSDPNFANLGLLQLLQSQRPLLMVSFWINQRFFGPDPLSFHVTNILLHFLNTVLLFALVRRMLSWIDLEDWKRQTFALFSAGLFLVHPVQNESVSYIAGRSESLSILFFLAAFLVFAYRKAPAISFPEAAAVLALFAAAAVTKEHTIVLPAALLLTDLVWGEGSPWTRVRNNWRLYAPMIVLGLAGSVMVWRVLNQADTAGLKVQGLPWHHYFFTQWRVWWLYLRLFLFPADLNADYEYAISRSPLDHFALASLLAMLAAVAVAFHFRKRFPLAFYGLLLFLLLLAPTSSVIPIKDAAAERRLYLPFIGLLLIACDFLRRINLTVLPLAASLSALLLAFAVVSNTRAAVWSDTIRLWEDTVRKSPHNGRAHFQLALAYYQANRCPDAIPQYAEAARIGPIEHRLLLDWALAYDCAGQPADALAKLSQALVLKDDAHTNSLLGMVHAKQQRWDDALQWLDKAEQRDPNYDMTYLYRGGVYSGMGNFARAAAEYRRALALSPDNTVAQQALAQVTQRLGNKQ